MQYDNIALEIRLDLIYPAEFGFSIELDEHETPVRC